MMHVQYISFRSSYYLLKRIRQQEKNMFVIRQFSVARFDAAAKRFRLCGDWFVQTPFMPVVRMGFEPVGNPFYAKRVSGFSTSWAFKPCNLCHHILSSFLFVDLAVDLASNWHGVEAIRNLGPVKDLIGATFTPDPTATHPIEQQDHSDIVVADPWWLHAC